MRASAVLLSLALVVSAAHGQYVETTILLPDSVSVLDEVRSLAFHSPTNAMYLGGSDSFLVAVDARTNSKLRRMTVGAGPHLLCSDPTDNKVYCANYDSTITVVDAATNQPLRTIPLGRRLTDLVYNEVENKLYCGNSGDSLVRVIDCAGDSIVSHVPVSFGPGALCYNRQFNRVYCAHKDRDEVTVIDCAADTVVSTVWVRGVEPQDVCYDSATNCIYTANSVSNTVSVIDCVADTFLRLVAVARAPRRIIAGPPGKVYCACDGMTVEVISPSGVKSVHTGHYPTALSFDPANNKVHCAGIYRGWVTVIDATEDTLLADVETGYPLAVCYNPAGNNTYVACHYDDCVEVIDGASDTVVTVISFLICGPGPLCYNTENNHLYCLDQSNDLLFIIDGESNSVLKSIKTCNSPLELVCNPFSSKVYFTGWYDSAVFVLDCADDSTVVTVDIGHRPGALCCGDDGKVYVLVGTGVAVIDGRGDTVRAVVPLPPSSYASTMCYDRTDKKLYVGSGYRASVWVIDSEADSLRATISMPPWDYSAMCWNQNHDKLYIGGTSCDSVVVIDCMSDTILRKIPVPMGIDRLYCDSACDKVYGIDSWDGYLRVIAAATDSLVGNLNIGSATAVLDNGKRGPANRLYCADYGGGTVAVVAGYKMDSVIRRISVGSWPSALAWNPTYSRMYVSNRGSSSISVIRDTLSPGVLETMNDERGTMNSRATVIRGVLFLPQLLPPHSSLLSSDGRKVMDLRPGANDVRHIPPGIYFVRSSPPAVTGHPSSVTKIVLTR